jgi:hypothetical protein
MLHFQSVISKIPATVTAVLPVYHNISTCPGWLCTMGNNTTCCHKQVEQLLLSVEFFANDFTISKYNSKNTSNSDSRLPVHHNISTSLGSLCAEALLETILLAVTNKYNNCYCHWHFVPMILQFQNSKNTSNSDSSIACLSQLFYLPQLLMCYGTI